jgi:oligoendopeptidase F
MHATLPTTTEEYLQLDWAQIAPYYEELSNADLTEATIDQWLRDWSRASDMMSEAFTRLRLATSADTTDESAKQQYFNFLDQIYQPIERADQKLREKLLASNLTPGGFAVPLRRMRAYAAIFRDANVALHNQSTKQSSEYNRIIGAQSVTWEGKETTLLQLQTVFQEADRAVREQAWRLASQRQLQDREAINALWSKFIALRKEIAQNADLPDFRAFVWQALGRFDYTPADCLTFHRAIEEVAVPAATRIYHRLRDSLGVSSLRPWDLGRDGIYPVTRPPLRPFSEMETFVSRTQAMFERLDPQLGRYFATMRQESLLDLDNRKNKAPGGNCSSFPIKRRPYIFQNAVGVHDDVQTLLHESGHAFHEFEKYANPDLRYSEQRDVDMEFNEVASMAMELLAAPYLDTQSGGFYSASDAARALIEHLEKIILFWPYMAVVDAFQHWVYENIDAAADAAACDAKWAELWLRFVPGIDWTGLEDAMCTGWQRKQHIHRRPFYYIEYGLAQLGAVQIWQNSIGNQAAAVARYRKALALGGTAPLPVLYETAGARFAFDTATMQTAVTMIEAQIEALQQQVVPE